MSYHIISIGISNYKCGSNLGFAKKDAELVNDSFVSSIENGEISFNKKLLDNEATLTEIRTVLDDANGNANSNDTLILYFSGHGTTYNSNAYLAPYDISPDNIKITGLPSEELRDWIDNAKYKNKIVILDCCYSGGVNVKTLPRPNTKAPTNIKTLDTMDFSSKGIFIYTACNAHETAIECPDLAHGLFTYCFIETLRSLQEKGDSANISDIISLVNESVTKKSTSYKHTQTPTSKLIQVGTIKIPTIKKIPTLSPEFISLPNELGPKVTPPMVFSVNIEQGQIKKELEKSILLVQSAEKDKMALLLFKRHFLKVYSQLRDDYNKMPKNIASVDDLNHTIATLEASSMQTMMLCAAAVLVGNEMVTDIIGQPIARITEWSYGQSGSNYVIKATDVIVLLLEYTLTICSIYFNNFDCLSKVLHNVSHTSIYQRPQQLVDYEDIHFAESLGSNAREVFKHILSYYEKQDWLMELLGVNKDELKNLILQSNLCLCVAKTHSSGPFYASYNDYDKRCVMPFADSIHFNKNTRLVIMPLFPDVSNEEKIKDIFADAINKINAHGGESWWLNELLKESDFVDKEKEKQ